MHATWKPYNDVYVRGFACVFSFACVRFVGVSGQSTRKRRRSGICFVPHSPPADSISRIASTCDAKTEKSQQQQKHTNTHNIYECYSEWERTAQSAQRAGNLTCSDSNPRLIRRSVLYVDGSRRWPSKRQFRYLNVSRKVVFVCVTASNHFGGQHQSQRDKELGGCIHMKSYNDFIRSATVLFLY